MYTESLYATRWIIPDQGALKVFSEVILVELMDIQRDVGTIFYVVISRSESYLFTVRGLYFKIDERHIL